MLHAHEGVCSTCGAASVTGSISSIFLIPFDFPPSSQRPRGRTGNKEGEVSDPPFFVPRTSPFLRECSTLCDTGVEVRGGGRSLLH